MDRIVFAAIAGFFGAVLGLVCWFLYGIGFSQSFPGMSWNPDALPWITALGGLFALFGLVLKERAADIVGDTIAGLLTTESGRDYGPNLSVGKIILVIAFIAAVIWYVATR